MIQNRGDLGSEVKAMTAAMRPITQIYNDKDSIVLTWKIMEDQQPLDRTWIVKVVSALRIVFDQELRRQAQYLFTGKPQVETAACRPPERLINPGSLSVMQLDR